MDRDLKEAEQGDDEVEDVVTISEVPHRPQHPQLENHLDREYRGEGFVQLREQEPTRIKVRMR